MIYQRKKERKKKKIIIIIHVRVRIEKRVCPRTCLGLAAAAAVKRAFGISATERRSLGATVPPKRKKKIEKLKKTDDDDGMKYGCRPLFAARRMFLPAPTPSPSCYQLGVRTFSASSPQPASQPPATLTILDRVSVFIFIRLQLRAAAAVARCLTAGREVARGLPAPAVVVQVSRVSHASRRRGTLLHASPAPFALSALQRLRPSLFLTQTKNRLTHPSTESKRRAFPRGSS